MWTYRLQVEADNSLSCYFITLTLNETDGNVYKSDVQNFIKRFRKNTDLKMRYYAIAEYGTNTWRPHYHALIFFQQNVEFHYMYYHVQKAWSTKEKVLGNIHVGSISTASIHYCTKHHITKLLTPEGLNKTFALMSQGIGRQYVEKYRKHHEDDIERAYVVSLGGLKQSMPRYYKDKLYTKTEKALIAIMSKPKELVSQADYLFLNSKKTESDYYRYLEQFKNDTCRKLSKIQKKSVL